MNHLDNDKDLDEILNTLVSLIASNQVDFSENTVSFEEAQRIGTKYTDKAKKAIDQYTQSKLKAFAGEVEALLKNKSMPKRGDVDPDIYVEVLHRTEGANATRGDLRESLKAIKEKWNI